MGLIHRSWFAFYHSHHGRLSRAVAKHFIDALLNFEKQQRVCEEIYRALLGQVPHEVERKSEKVKGPTKQQGHDGKITSSTELTRSLPKKRGRRRIDESHQNKLAAIIAPHMEGNGWMKPDILEKICQKLDKARVPGASDRLWKRVLEDDHSTGTHRVTDNIKYRLYKSPNPARNYLPK